MKRVFVKLESAWVYLTAREEIDRTFLILHLDVLVVANEEPRLCQLKNVLNVTDWADNLACSHILNVLPTRDRCPLYLLRDAAFAK